MLINISFINFLKLKNIHTYDKITILFDIFMEKFFHYVQKLHEICLNPQCYCSPIIKSHILHLHMLCQYLYENRSITNHQVIYDKIDILIFKLLNQIANNYGTNQDLINIFSEMLIEYIDTKKKRNEDVDELTSIFNKMYVALPIEGYMAKLSF